MAEPLTVEAIQKAIDAIDRLQPPWLSPRYRAELKTSEFVPVGTFIWTGRGGITTLDLSALRPDPRNGYVVCHPDTRTDARNLLLPFGISDDHLAAMVVYHIEHKDAADSPLRSFFLRTDVL